EQTRLDLDAGAMAGPAHQIPGRQALGGELHAHALDPAPPGTARTGRPECQPVIWLLAVSSGHRTPPCAVLAFAESLVKPMSSRDERHQREAIGPDDRGAFSSGRGTRTGPTVGS